LIHFYKREDVKEPGLEGEGEGCIGSMSDLVRRCTKG